MYLAPVASRSGQQALLLGVTAVSIPDPLFRAADRLARRLRLSRSELYAWALERLVDSESDDDVTARLDEVYATEDSRLDRDGPCAASRPR